MRKSRAVVNRPGVRWTVLAAIAAAVAPSGAVAQPADACGAALRGGLRLAYPHAIVDGSPIADMSAGATVAIGLACPLSAKIRGGFGVEANLGPRLSLIHLLAVADRALRTADGGDWTVWLRGGIGWVLTARVTTPTSKRSCKGADLSSTETTVRERVRLLYRFHCRASRRTPKP